MRSYLVVLLVAPLLLAATEDRWADLSSKARRAEIAKDYVSAERHWLAALEEARRRFEPGDERLVHTYHSIAVFFETTGQSRPAIGHYLGELFELSGREEATLRFPALRALARLHESLGEFERALEYRRQAERIGLDHPVPYGIEATMDLAEHYRLRGDRSSAIDHYNEALRLTENSTSYYETRKRVDILRRYGSYVAEEHEALGQRLIECADRLRENLGRKILDPECDLEAAQP